MATKRPTKAASGEAARGHGDELHQRGSEALTTNHGVPLSDNQNSLRADEHGPTLLEDFVLREKIHHFDHERIPERIVHARGSGAHGYFELTHSLREVTRAKVLTEVGKRTEVFVRFSTVAGGAGSVDTPRDVRGFAVKFYTSEGNWDLVGNNIPVFFIQDAMKFPDLVHAVKMEADRGYPQAASAHDTFWDFIGLMPEATHMVLWAMSDRTIPRSLRMMEGFGVHTFRLVNDKGHSTFVKFHWRPVLGLQSTCWDEAVKIAGADPDYHRRDLYEAIARGDQPEWELCVQLFSAKQAERFPFDVRDATKLVPEELVPLQVIGRLVLNRNPDNFFAETEQVAFLPSNVPPGIDFSEDPLLQGRLFSYLDTQLSRLGSTNFFQLPVNRPKGCPFRNMQRDGHMQQQLFKGRANYEPNSLAEAGEEGGPRAREDGFSSTPVPTSGVKARLRPESFADHYSQARLFFRSQSAVEQAHIVAAFVFELSKVALPHVRTRMLASLRNVDDALAKSVAEGLGMPLPKPLPAAQPAIPMAESPALRLIGKFPATSRGRAFGLLVTDGADAAVVKSLKDAVKKAKATITVIAPKIGGVALSGGERLDADAALAGSPSVLFDAVAVVASAQAAKELCHEPAALAFLRDAHTHLKAIGFSQAAKGLLDAAGIVDDDFVLPLEKRAKACIEHLGERAWWREKLRG